MIVSVEKFGGDLMHGIITYYNEKKGFGFISSGAGSVFFHCSKWKSENILPRVGLRVGFQEVSSNKGLNAIEIEPLGNNDSVIFLKTGNTRIKISDIATYYLEFGNYIDEHFYPIYEFLVKEYPETTESGGYTGYSRYNKDEIIEAIIDCDNGDESKFANGVFRHIMFMKRCLRIELTDRTLYTFIGETYNIGRNGGLIFGRGDILAQKETDDEEDIYDIRQRLDNLFC